MGETNKFQHSEFNSRYDPAYKEQTGQREHSPMRTPPKRKTQKSRHPKNRTRRGMLGNDYHNWAAIAQRPTAAESVPRRALMAKLDRSAALTIVRAPSSYGKSSLIASWLRAHLILATDPGVGVCAQRLIDDRRVLAHGPCPKPCRRHRTTRSPPARRPIRSPRSPQL